MNGEVYENWDDLVRSLRPKSIVRVYRPYLLGGDAGTTRKRRRIWAERADQVKEKGNKLVSIDPPLTGARLAMLAAAAPILKYMIGWDFPKIEEYIAKKKWKWELGTISV